MRKGGVRIALDFARPLVHGAALSVTGGPAHQSLLPSLVDKQHLPNAIAFNSIQFNLSRVLGPMLGTPVLLAVAVGFGLSSLRAHRVAGPVLEFRYYGAIEGRVTPL